MALSPPLAVAPGARLVDHTRHQTALRLLPFLFVLYVTNYLDRTSLAYAAIGMRRDLGFSDAVTGFAIGVFFISYVAPQIPGALLVERWSALLVGRSGSWFLPWRDRLPESLVPSGRSWESYEQSGVRAFCTDYSGKLFYDNDGSAIECLSLRHGPLERMPVK